MRFSGFRHRHRHGRREGCNGTVHSEGYIEKDADRAHLGEAGHTSASSGTSGGAGDSAGRESACAADFCDRGNAVSLFDMRGELCGMQGREKTLWCGKELCVTLRTLCGRECAAEDRPSDSDRVITVLDGECEITVRRGKSERKLHAVRGSVVAIPRGASCDIFNPRHSSRAAISTVWARHQGTGARLSGG